MIEVTVKRTEAETVAFLTMMGPYDQMPGSFERLYSWVGEHGFTPSGPPEAVHFTSPDETPEESAVWELRSPIADEPAPSGPDADGLGVKHVAEMTMAVVTHKGPYETIELSYRELTAWVEEHGYEIAGPPEEVYFSDPNEVPEDEYLTEVRLPVRQR